MKTYNFKVVGGTRRRFRWKSLGVARLQPGVGTKRVSTWGATETESLRNIGDLLSMVVESMLARHEHIPEEPSDEGEVTVKPLVAVTV
jgi:hypothetical protein